MSQYVYQHTGGRFWNWRHGSPQGIRAAEARELSGMGDSSIIRPGVPEPLTGLGDLGSGVSLLTTLLVLGGGLWIASKVVGRGKSGAGYKKNPAKRRGRKRRSARIAYPPRSRRRRRKQSSRRKWSGARGKGWAVMLMRGGKTTKVYGEWDPMPKWAAQSIAKREREAGYKARVVRA